LRVAIFRQIVRKKAALALYWFYRRSPSLLDQIEPFLKAALLDKEASVVFVALELWKKILAVRCGGVEGKKNLG
jgi:vesicle coat complex subunit